MEGVVQEDGVIVNIGELPINPGGFEKDILDAINRLNTATTERMADEVFNTFISLRGNGVIFPSRLMFTLINRAAYLRVPTLDAICVLPGMRDVVSTITENWGWLDSEYSAKPYLRRALINISLCTSCDRLLDISPSVFTHIINSWKKPDGTFYKFANYHVCCVTVIYHLAKAMSHHNPPKIYENVVRQPRLSRSLSKKFGPDSIIENPNENTKLWIELFNEWLHGQSLKSTKKQRSAFAAALEWVMTYPEDVRRDPKVFLSQHRTSPTLIDFLKNGNEDLSSEAQKTATYIYKFMEWIIDTYLRDFDEDGIVSIGVNPLTYSDQLTIQGAWRDTIKPSEATSNPLPTAWRMKAQKILTENDYAWPKSLKNQYVKWLNPEAGCTEQIWVPTLTCLFEIMLELPLRRIQVLCLDSGEGDLEVYDPEGGQWVKNTGPAAGYWKNDPTAKVKHRGVIKDLGKPGKPLIGFSINTNKTADKSAPSGEKAGYDIPWQNETVIRSFTQLREWQQKYNPQKKPTPFRSFPRNIFGYTPTDRVLRETPDRFYLFRTPCGSDPFLPPTYNMCFNFWCELMAQLERVLRDEGEDVEIVLSWNKRSGEPERVAFNIHGLRVATLTAFVEAGVPIEILSKLVAGHASILMTLYYIKFNEVTISNLILQKALQVKENAAEQLKRHLENKSWERAKKLAVYSDEDCFRTVMNTRFSPLWSNQGYGVCPHGGTRCEDGGPVVRKNGDKGVYGPVPGGKHNCLRCRHFISGTPFLVQMWMQTNKLLVHAQKMSAEYDRFVSELNELEDEKYRKAQEGPNAEIPGQLRARIKELEGICDMRSSALNETLLDLHAAWRFTESIKGLLENVESNGDDKNLPALLCSNSADFEFGHREGTRFEAIFNVIQASRIYPFLEDEILEMEAGRFVDAVLQRGNLQSLSLQPLTRAEKQACLDAAGAFLLAEVGAFETQQIYEGKNTLNDLGLEKKFIKTIKEAVPQLAGYGNQNLLVEVING